MKYVIFSDVHANYEAFQAVLAFSQINAPDRMFHLGDIVGYGADPVRCMDLIVENNIVNLAGNHDHAVAGLLNIEYFNFYAKDSILWTRRQLTDDRIQMLKSLPLYHRLDRILMVHSTPEHSESWDYVFTIQDAERIFSYMTREHLDICFIGHSHQPVIFEKPPGQRAQYDEKEELRIVKGHQYIINVGSVGQPRDGSPLACVAFYDHDRMIYRLYRIPYSIESAQQKMIEADIDPFLIQRIAHGR